MAVAVGDDWYCSARANHPRCDGGVHHCFHDRKDDVICCWCGGLFEKDNGPVAAVHGEYAPKKGKK